VKSALVLGGASSVWNDAASALSLYRLDLTIVINDMIGAWLGQVDIAVTLHPEKADKWIRQRRLTGANMDFETWAHARKPGSPKIDHTTDDWGGSSGLFAVKVALECGCDRIVLAGVPMSADDAHFFDSKPWNEASAYHKAWLAHQSEIAPYVRSMSGWTAELLGRPDASWLARAA